jgi:hypothetical protein
VLVGCSRRGSGWLVLFRSAEDRIGRGIKSGRHRHRDTHGSAVRVGMNLQLSTELVQSLPHSDEPNTKVLNIA